MVGGLTKLVILEKLLKKKLKKQKQKAKKFMIYGQILHIMMYLLKLQKLVKEHIIQQVLNTDLEQKVEGMYQGLNSCIMH